MNCLKSSYSKSIIEKINNYKIAYLPFCILEYIFWNDYILQKKIIKYKLLIKNNHTFNLNNHYYMKIYFLQISVISYMNSSFANKKKLFSLLLYLRFKFF